MMLKEMLALMLVGTAAAVSLSLTGAPAYSQTGVNPDAQAMTDFAGRIATYVELRKKLTASLPKLPEKATAEQLQAHEAALEKLVVSARGRAKKGDLFGSMTAVVRKLFIPVFRGPEGDTLRKAIHDEAPAVMPGVNTRYPEEVPLSTMPPELLKMLPKLEDTLEYRFIGRHLILLDVPAQVIVDVIDNAMPA